MKTTRAILAVHNDADTLISLEYVLENAGFTTTTTWHDAEALQLLRKHLFEVVLVGQHPQIDASAISQYCARTAHTKALNIADMRDHEHILRMLQEPAPRSRPSGFATDMVFLRAAGS